jgi:Rab proteins geranylgeranyltransferase component A
MSLFKETFDVVVVGTDATHSILAGALSLAGKRVLHLDRREYYGGIDASFTMEQLVEFTLSQKKEDEENGDDDDDVVISEDIMRCDVMDELVLMDVSCDGQKALDFVLDRKKRVCHEAASVAYMASQDASRYESQASEQIEIAKVTRTKLDEEKKKEKEDINDTSTEKKKTNTTTTTTTTDKKEEGEVNETNTTTTTTTTTTPKTNLEKLVSLLDKSRQFNLDFTPRIILARGQLVDSMVRSNVHRYMEFTTLHHTSVGFRTKKSNEITLQHVPSNKRDVFLCSWLTLREKRSLMHFLRFCMDFAFETKQGGVEVTKQNETMLQQQRSLARPQNKKSATKSYDLNKYSKFEDMLEASNMSSKLRSIATYGLGFSNSSIEPLETKLAMKRVCAYVSSLGRHGTTAFLCSIYGAGEMPQSFCRLAAVNRAIYKLRERVRGLAVEKKKNMCRGVIIQGGCVRCNRVVMNASTLPSSLRVRGGVTIVRMTCVLSSRVFRGEDNTKLRTLGVVVPGEGKTSAVRCLQFSAGVRACPEDHVVLYLWSTILSKDSEDVR